MSEFIEEHKRSITYVIIGIMVFSYCGGLVFYLESQKDPYSIEVSITDADQIVSFRLNGRQYSEFPFNITFNVKSLRCWIDVRYNEYEAGSYVEVKADRVYFDYQSLIDNNGFANITYSGFSVLITLRS